MRSKFSASFYTAGKALRPSPRLWAVLAVLGAFLVSHAESFGTALRPIGSQKARSALVLRTIMRVPGISTQFLGPGKLFSFGDGRVDATRSLYLLSDRNAGAVDVFDTKRSVLIRRIAAGPCRQCLFTGLNSNSLLTESGPNAIALVGNSSKAWIGDVGSIKLIDYTTGSIVKSVAIVAADGSASHFRSNHICFDAGRLLMVVNPDDPTPFVTLVDARTGKLLRRIEFPHGFGLGDCAYRLRDRTFYLADEGSPQRQSGALLAISTPATGRNTPRQPIPSSRSCAPRGLAFDGRQRRLMLGCDSIAEPIPRYILQPERVPLETAMFDAQTQRFNEPVRQVGGAGGIAFDPKMDRWYVAAWHMTDNGYPDGSPTPVLGIISARSGKWLENIPTGDYANSVAVDTSTGFVFVPIRQTALANGGVMVFQPNR